jgi:hypothetical protein
MCLSHRHSLVITHQRFERTCYVRIQRTSTPLMAKIGFSKPHDITSQLPNFQSSVAVLSTAKISYFCQALVRLDPVLSVARVLADILLISAQVTEFPRPPAATMEPLSNYQGGVLQQTMVHLLQRVPHRVSITYSFIAQEQVSTVHTQYML